MDRVSKVIESVILLARDILPPPFASRQRMGHQRWIPTYVEMTFKSERRAQATRVFQMQYRPPLH